MFIISIMFYITTWFIIFIYIIGFCESVAWLLFYVQLIFIGDIFLLKLIYNVIHLKKKHFLCQIVCIILIAIIVLGIILYELWMYLLALLYDLVRYDRSYVHYVVKHVIHIYTILPYCKCIILPELFHLL